MMLNVKFTTRNKGFIWHLTGCEEVRLLLKCPFWLRQYKWPLWACSEILGLINHHTLPRMGGDVTSAPRPLWGVGEEERGETTVHKSGLSYPKVRPLKSQWGSAGQSDSLAFICMPWHHRSILWLLSLLSCQRNQSPNLPFPNCLRLIIAWTVANAGLKEALMRYCSLISCFKGRRQSVYFAWKRSLMGDLLFFCWGQAELCYLRTVETAEVFYSCCSSPLAISLPCARIKSYEWSPAACPPLWQPPLCRAAAMIHSPAALPVAGFPAFGCPGKPWGITRSAVRS